MDNPSPLPPLYGSRYVYQENFNYYFPFSNTPAKDLLETVSWDLKEPTVLVLGCGDLSSVFYTIWKNFNRGYEQKFTGVHFTLHDRSGAILARNILFLYLCIRLPKERESRQNWLCAMWSIWFCHELLPAHEQLLRETLKALLTITDNWTDPSNPLSSFVEFHTTQTLSDVKALWSMWYYEKASLKDMKQGRERELSKLRGNTSGEASVGLFDLTGMLGANITHDITEKLRKEYKAYLDLPSVYPEQLTGGEPRGKTVANPTFFEVRNDYTMYYTQCPYRCFHQVHIISVEDMIETGMHVSYWDRKYMDVSPESFEKNTLLANSFQQFSAWVSCTADVLRLQLKRVSFIFACKNVFEFTHICLLKYDVVFVLNTLDHYAPSAIILAAIKLVKDKGRLFSGTFLYRDIGATVHDYIKACFGFDSKFLPVVCGIRCINHEGVGYAATVSTEHCCVETADTDPSQASMREKLIAWERVEMTPPLMISSLDDCPDVCHALFESFYICCSPILRAPNGKAILNNLCTDTAIKILQSFALQLEPSVANSYELWEPLCIKLKEQKIMHTFFASMQTQALICGIHIHLIVDKYSCPICMDMPLSGYLGQFIIGVPLKSVSDRHPIFSFFISREKMEVPQGLDKILYMVAQMNAMHNPAMSHIDCCTGEVVGGMLQLKFLAPLEFVRHNYLYSLYSFTRHQGDRPGTVYNWPTMITSDCKLKEHLVSGPLIPKVKLSSLYIPFKTTSLGTSVKNSGGGESFETLISLDPDKPDLLTSKLEIKQPSPEQIEVFCADNSLTITYPYPVAFGKINLQRSKKAKTVLLKAPRRQHYYDEEGPMFYVNPENQFSFPVIVPGTLELFMRMQYATKRSIFKSKCGVCILTHTVEQTVKQLLSSEGSIFLFTSQKDNQLWAIIEVLNRVIDITRKVPALHLSYCFVDHLPVEVSEVLRSAVHMSCKKHGKDMTTLQFPSEPFRYVKENIRNFSAHTIQSTILKPKVVPDFNLVKSVISQAVVYPLYEDPARAALDLQCATCGKALKPETMKRCECQEIGYCNDECQKKNSKEHLKECKLLSKQNGKAESKISGVQFEVLVGAKIPTVDNPAKRPGASKVGSATGTKANSEGCANCYKVVSSLMTCSKCRKTKYCSKDCQKAHWKKHKKDCTGTKPAEKELPLCSYCYTKIRGKPLQCTGCKKMSYCSRQCQTSHWSQHKSECEGSTQANESATNSSLKSEQKETKSRQTETKSEQTETKSTSASEIPSSSPETFTLDTPSEKKATAAEHKPRTKQKAGVNLRCSKCGKKPVKPRRCARCHKVFYCGQECQKAHWKEHKAFCKSSK